MYLPLRWWLWIKSTESIELIWSGHCGPLLFNLTTSTKPNKAFVNCNKQKILFALIDNCRFLTLLYIKFELHSEQHVCMFVSSIAFVNTEVNYVSHILIIIWPLITISTFLLSVCIFGIFIFWQNFIFSLKNPISPHKSFFLNRY